MDREYLNDKIDLGLTLNEMASDYGCDITKIRYWMKKYNLKTKTHRSWSDDEMTKAISSSFSVSEVLRKIGLTVRAGNFDTVKRFVKKYNIDISHLKGRGWRSGIRSVSVKYLKNKDYLLVENSVISRTALKKYLLYSGKLKNQCSICNCSEVWQGKPITMVMDHINGVNDDNRIENLRMLCPNCNSQQSTFCRGRFFSQPIAKEDKKCSQCNSRIHCQTKTYLCKECNGIKQRKVPRPSKEELEKLVSENSMVSLGKKFGVSDNAVRKWMRQYGLLKELMR